MQYAEAFHALGYELASPRQDWSACNGVKTCISLWRSELATQNKLPWIDTKIHCNPLEEWRSKPGRLRISHLATAIEHSDGFVDVVLVSGQPGEGYEDAHPWFSEQRRAKWRVLSFEPSTGHFEAAVVPT